MILEYPPNALFYLYDVDWVHATDGTIHSVSVVKLPVVKDCGEIVVAMDSDGAEFSHYRRTLFGSEFEAGMEIRKHLISGLLDNANEIRRLESENAHIQGMLESILKSIGEAKCDL